MLRSPAAGARGKACGFPADTCSQSWNRPERGIVCRAPGIASRAGLAAAAPTTALLLCGFLSFVSSCPQKGGTARSGRSQMHAQKACCVQGRGQITAAVWEREIFSTYPHTEK